MMEFEIKHVSGMDWVVFGLLFAIAETAWFGFNELPSCRAERWCDGIVFALVWFGVIKMIVKHEVEQALKDND